VDQALTNSVRSGTTSVHGFPLTEENRWIVVENMEMCGGEVRLRDAPSRTRRERETQVQPAVRARLERSLKDHADVWAELSKY